MKCFYHNDLDGRCAAFCVFSWVGIKPDENGKMESEFIEINYNKRFPIEKIRRGEQVWIVDFSISPAEMNELLDITDDVTWIDHHKTAIEKYADFGREIRGVRKDGEAGCALTFKYMHWWTERGDGDINIDLENRDIPVPTFIQLTEDWDIWKFQYGEQTKRFHVGCEMEDTHPMSEFWWECLDVEFVNRVAENGEIALRFRDRWAKNFMKSWSFPVSFEGHKCIAANIGSCNSEYFQSVENGYDILMPFVFDGKRWSVSLYSQTVDVGAIAKKYGGGGHVRAAGFQCDVLPFVVAGAT